MWEPRSLLAAQLSTLHVAEEEESDATLAKLPAEILNVIAETLHDVLLPHHVGRLACTCRAIQAGVKDALARLRVEHREAHELLNSTVRVTDRPALHRPIIELYWQRSGLTPAAAPTLLSILRSEALVEVELLYLWKNALGDEGAAAVATAAAAGGLPRLKRLHLASTQIGPDGIKALGSACAGGAFRHVQVLNLSHNPIGRTMA